jgi:hypothetical protein
MTREARRQLYEALTAHKIELETYAAAGRAPILRSWIAGLRLLGCF